MDKPIRVLHILQRMEAGGTQALLMNLYRNIDRKKIQFDFLVEYPNKQFYDDEIKKLGGKIYYTNVRNDYNVFKFKQEIKRIIKENNYKIVHVHAYTIGYFALKAAKECGVPVRIAHSHSNNMTKDIKSGIKKMMQKLYLLHATDYMACSNEAGEYLFKNKKYEVLNNAIDADKFVFDSKISNRIKHELNICDSFIIGHVGRFKPEKNHEFLINVFMEICKNKENAKLVLIGDGSYKNDIINLVKKNKIEDKVLFLGNRDNVNELIQTFDVFVFPSLYEGLGIVAIESQAAGTPIIISEGVPNEAMISPLCKKLSLNDTYSKWAEEAISIANHKLAHTNMKKSIINANYNLNSSVSWIQHYYIEKFLNNERG